MSMRNSWASCPAMDYMATTMSTQQGGTDHSGSVTLLRPDGTPYPGSPFTGGGLPGPWAVVVDGNDNVWISNFAMPNSPIVQLCGVRTETCPPGIEDRRPNFAARRLCRAAAFRCRPTSPIDPAGQRLGDEQLAGHRQLYRQAPRGAFDPLRRPGRRDLLRHGQARARAADRTGARALRKAALDPSPGPSPCPLWVKS